MKKIVLYIVLLVAGIGIGAGGYIAFFSGTITGEHTHTDEDGTLYTCGMHPNIIETEPGNCPICGMKLIPIKGSSKKEKSKGERKIIYWRAPMNPNEIYDAPGKSQMGMDLVPVYEDEAEASGAVTVNGSVLQSMNVKLQSVKEKSLSGTIYTNGVVIPDERKTYSVTTKINGWIDKLYINYIGQKVKSGQKLVDIYSPELVAAENEVLTALSYGKNNNTLLENAIRKLELFDITSDEIQKLISTKKVKRTITLYAPFNGTVLTKNILSGDKITAGKELMKISDLSEVWMLADIYESEINKVNVGDSAKISFTYFPQKSFSGKISFIYPTVDSKTRTVKVRINMKNTSGKIKPEMFATVTLIGKKQPPKPVVPETAVIRSGKRNIVVLSLGEGKFKPVDVKLGLYADGLYQILSGIKAGDVIVTSGQFMIDSESSLRAAVKLFSSQSKKVKKQKMSDKEMKNMNSAKPAVKKKTVSATESEIVRTGIIDVEAIDKNKDGKVYQDLMDWNVISDKPGRCPVCGMYLQEVTIDEAKSNLKKNGFEYK